MNKRMYKINLGIAEELVGYMISLEMEDPKGYDLHYSVVYNGVYNPGVPKIGDQFTMSMGTEGYRLDGDVCVPMIYRDTSGFQEKMYWYLCDEYDFDLFNWGMQYGFTFEQSSILFDICHELGHCKNWLHDLNKYGHFKTLDDDYDDKEQLYFVTSEEELFIRYRQLRTESYADKTSVEFLKKYGDTLAQFVRRGLLTEALDFSEVEKYF